MKSIILDCNHLLNRNFHIKSFQNLSSFVDGKEVFTGAVYGFVWSIKKIMSEKKQSDIIHAVWDGGGKNWRHAIDPNYKANRSSKADDFYFQLHLSYTFLQLLGLTQYRAEGIEADDLIGSLVKQERIKGNEIVIISSDKDFNQLVSKHVSILHPEMANISSKLMTPSQVKEDYGIEPHQFVDYLALIGDSGDNVQGIDGVAKKTAVELILGNESVDNIINSDTYYVLKDGEKKSVSNKLKEKLDKSKEILKISKQLVKIKCDFDLSKVMKKEKPNLIELKNLFKKYEFKSCLQRFDEFIAEFS